VDISSEYNVSVSVTFNVFNISLFDVGDDLKMNSFNERERERERQRERERERERVIQSKQHRDIC
jgi:hypothetical protein